MTLALPFLFALLVSALLVPICRIAALRLGYIVQSVDRRAPSKTKTRFGGVAIALTLFICATAVGAFHAAPVLLLCSGALFLVGVTGDAITLKPSTKLVAQIAMASVFLFFDYRLYWADSNTLDSIITVFWIVGITSAFNLLDNMDGLCGGIALIAGTAFLCTVLPVGPGSVLFVQTQYLAILLGAITGFLIYNVYPASVVMGESGSLLIGLNMAAMTLQFAPGRGSDLVSIVAVPLLLLLIPIIDAALVALSRLGKDPSAVADRAPSSHRLVAIGMSHRAAVGLLWALAAVSGVIGVAADRSPQGLAGVAGAMFIIGMGMLAVYLARVRIHEDVGTHQVPPSIVPLGIESGYWRRLVEVVLDLLLVSVAYYGAYRLRFEGAEYTRNFPYFFRSYPIVLGTQMTALFVGGAYRGIWRYFSLSDGLTLGKGVLLGVVSAQAILLWTSRLAGYSLNVFVVYGILLLLLLVGARASFRVIGEFMQRQWQLGRRLVIYGAGDSASVAVRYLLSDERSPYRIIGFVDEDVRKRNVRIHGYPVIGGYDHLAGMIMAGEVDIVAVTDQTVATPALAWLCANHQVPLYHLAIDWREVPATEAVAVGSTVAMTAGQPRVVPFPRLSSGPSAVTTGRSVHQPPAHVRDGAPDALRGTTAAPTPTRVVHIITRLILGGAQENTVSTAIGQHRDPRFDVTVVCGVDEAGEGNMFTEVARAGVRTVVMPSLVREIRPFTDVKALFDLYRFLTRGRYTIVHTHSSKAGIIGRLAAYAAGVPIVVHTLHGLAFHDFQASWNNRLYIALERICAPISHRLISVSDRVTETALARGIGRPDQYVTIHSGIELDLLLSVRDRLSVEDAKRQVGIPPDAPVVGKIARLFPLKGHEQFFASATEIVQQIPETYFLLVGDGPLRDQLFEDAKRLGLRDRVVMVGRVPPERVPECIQAMDVVVHTSLREGIARVLPQAGAVGKPVVTFDLDGAPEVVQDGVSGYLVAAVDVSGIARRTVELLRAPERRAAFGQAGRIFAKEYFSAGAMVERINAVYVELLSRPHPVSHHT